LRENNDRVPAVMLSSLIVIWWTELPQKQKCRVHIPPVKIFIAILLCLIQSIFLYFVSIYAWKYIHITIYYLGYWICSKCFINKL
jgi:hypothetical protein